MNSASQLTLELAFRRWYDHRVLTEHKDPETSMRILDHFRQEIKKGREWIPMPEFYAFSLNPRGRFSELRALGFHLEWNGNRRESAYRLVNP